MLFPDHPSEGDRITDNETTGRTWEFDGTKWVLVGAVLSDVNFDSVSPIDVETQLTDEGKTGKVIYSFDMESLPRINPN